MKKLEDNILRKLTEASTSGCNALKVYLDGADTLVDNPIACIPIIPDTAGGFIASMYKEEYAKLVPYLKYFIANESIAHQVKDHVYQCVSLIFIRKDMLTRANKSKEVEAREPEISLIHDGDVGYYVSSAHLRDQLQNAIDGCSQRENCCGVYVRSIASLQLLGQFPVKTPDTPEDERQRRIKYYTEFIQKYGHCKVIAERMLKRQMGLSISEFFELFVDDFDHDYVVNNPIGRDDDNRVKLLCFFLKHFNKETSFKTCDKMSIIMKNADDTIMDYLDLTF